MEIDWKRSLIATVIVFVLMEIYFNLGGRIPFIGQLPGDIAIARGNSVVIIPLASSILISIIFTIVFYVIDSARE